MLDAWALAQAVEQSETLPGALARAVSLRRKHVPLYQWLTALFTPVYQSDSRVPFLRDTLVGPVSKLWPATCIQAAMVSGLIGDPLGRCGLPISRLGLATTLRCSTPPEPAALTAR